jgi:serpin B
MRDTWHSACDPMDFRNDSAGATSYINDWASGQTHGHIRDLIPAGALDQDTRLVVANAIYFKAPWATVFPAANTRVRDFHPPAGPVASVPTMFMNGSLGYARRAGCQIVTIPYGGREIQFVIILPDATNGLAVLEQDLKPEMLAECATLPDHELNLFLPKLDLEPAAVSLAAAFQALGMKNAFDVPRGSANFDRMAPRGPDKYLYISDIFHKAFLKLDESGTEAAAASAVVMMAVNGVMISPPQPIEVRVDHPFLFAIQDRTSGACLFLGRVTDPR